jgi:hypothetical protein
MRLPALSSLSSLIGFPCLALTLLLCLPGVQAVRADGEPGQVLHSEIPAAGACGEAVGARAARVGEELERRIAAEHSALRSLAQADESAAEGVIVLNNSGYNYGGGMAIAPVPPAEPSEGPGARPAAR